MNVRQVEVVSLAPQHIFIITHRQWRFDRTAFNGLCRGSAPIAFGHPGLFDVHKPYHSVSDCLNRIRRAAGHYPVGNLCAYLDRPCALLLVGVANKKRKRWLPFLYLRVSLKRR